MFHTYMQRKLHFCLDSYILENDILIGEASFCVIFLSLTLSCEDMHDYGHGAELNYLIVGRRAFTVTTQLCLNVYLLTTSNNLF
jgi:hypothetical protein